MKSICIIFLLLCTKVVHAHEPDLSNLMIYEQNGKCLLVIKSSLTAFEGEIDYLFGKNAYKTPEAFQLLVTRYFQNSCVIIMNDDTIKLNNPKVFLGHETTVFAELLNVPNKFKSIYVKNSLFQDMPSNMCELIITLKGRTQKQYLLNNGNKHEVKLVVENDKWTVVKSTNWSYSNLNLLLGLVFFLLVTAIIFLAIKENKNGH